MKPKKKWIDPLPKYSEETLRWGLTRCITDETRKDIEDELKKRLDVE